MKNLILRQELHAPALLSSPKQLIKIPDLRANKILRVANAGRQGMLPALLKEQASTSAPLPGSVHTSATLKLQKQEASF